MGQGVTRAEVRRLSVGRGGSGALSPLSVCVSLPHKIEVLALQGTEDEEEAGDEKRQGRKGDERGSIGSLGHGAIIAARGGLATAGRR
jgi:hypothetical protein